MIFQFILQILLIKATQIFSNIGSTLLVIVSSSTTIFNTTQVTWFQIRVRRYWVIDTGESSKILVL